MVIKDGGKISSATALLMFKRPSIVFLLLVQSITWNAMPHWYECLELSFAFTIDGGRVSLLVTFKQTADDDYGHYINKNSGMELLFSFFGTIKAMSYNCVSYWGFC